jgi:hypothetical protein
MKENKYKKHDEKRQRIQISLYSGDLKVMKEKYGCILDATQSKSILLNGEFKQITRNEDPVLSETITQLRKIGNNINQLAHIANAKNEISAELFLLNHLTELRLLVNELRKMR